MKKIKMPEVSTLANTRAWLDDNYSYEDYKEWCEMNDIEPENEDSHAFFEWKVEQSSEDFDCDMSNIKYHEKYQNAEYIITGSLGLWWGHPSVQPVRITGLYEAIMKCINNCDDIEIQLNNKTGVIDVYGFHHDGTNCFEIRELRDYCSDAYTRAEENYQYGDTENIELKRGWFKKIENLYWAA